MSCFCFRIRKKYFDLIVRGEKIVEYRRDSPFWQKRIFNSDPGNEHLRENVENPERLFKFEGLKGEGFTAVFICGKRIHRREVVRISRIKTPLYFSDQGKKDVDTETCFAFHLGDEFNE